MLQTTNTPADEPETINSYANAVLVLTTLHHASATAYAYSRFTESSQTAFAVGALFSGFLATMGLFTLLFSGDATRRGKSGFDKDTSSFPFKNSESYKNKKKAAKES